MGIDCPSSPLTQTLLSNGTLDMMMIMITIENDTILEFEQYVSNSNIAKVECMKSCNK